MLKWLGVFSQSLLDAETNPLLQEKQKPVSLRDFFSSDFLRASRRSSGAAQRRVAQIRSPNLRGEEK